MEKVLRLQELFVDQKDHIQLWIQPK